MIIDVPQKQHIPMLRPLWKEAFGDSDAFLNCFFKTAFSPNRARCVTENGELTAALYWFDCLYRDQRVAYFYAIATAKAWQGKGFCKRLMTDTHELLQSLGYAGAILVPGGEDLFGFYRKMGYQTTCYMQTLACKAAEQGMPIRKIQKEEYEKLRSLMLPSGGVVQPNENLDFLNTQFHFYAGDDLLLASRVENRELQCAELLGNTAKFPMAIRALQCDRGQARTIGKDIPFAMYLPFDSTLTPPTYFGLAFD